MANCKLSSDRQHQEPNLSLPSLLTPEPPRARNRRLHSGLTDPTLAAACTRVPGASIPLITDPEIPLSPTVINKTAWSPELGGSHKLL